MSGTLTATSSANNLKVLSDDALEVLRLRGENTAVISGFRSVSNTSYTSEDSVESEIIVDIPDELESKETLRFLEFVPETAEIVWEKLLIRKQTDPYRASILDEALRWIKSFEDVVGADEDWFSAMEALGLSASSQERIMDPRFEDMRLGFSLHETVVDMVMMRYEFLCNLDSVVRSPPSQTLGRKSSKLNFDNTFTTIPAPEPTFKAKYHKMKTKGSSQPKIENIPDEPPQNLENHLILHKGASKDRLSKVVRPNGKLDIAAIASTPPTDFNRNIGGLFFSKQHHVAWQYAKWAHQKADPRVVQVAILHIAIPLPLLQGHYELVGDEFRRFVWANRRNEPQDEDLEYLQTVSWLVGPIVHNSTNEVLKMTDRSEMKILKIAGKSGGSTETASQHYTHQYPIYRLLNEHCQNKVWIEYLNANETKEEKGKGKGEEKKERKD